MKRIFTLVIFSSFFFLNNHYTYGQTENFKSSNLFGVPGLIDMPTAGSFQDGQLSFSSSKLGPNLRNTISFQALPRVALSFRYSGIGDKAGGSYSSSGYTYWDRSFDLRMDLIKENNLTPNLTLGLQDVIGTGLYSAEYLVASKSFNKRLTLTGGFGWGRLGGQNIISKNGIRNHNSGGKFGGLLRTEQIFRGNIGTFGGVEYLIKNKLKIKAEITSDNYSYDKNITEKLPSSSINYGLDYKVNQNTNLKTYFGNNNNFGLQLSFSAVPSKIYGGNYLESVPQPFYSLPYNDKILEAKNWKRIEKDLKKEKISLIAHKVMEKKVIIIIENNHYSTETKAIGRSLRILSKFVPIEKEIFEVVMSKNGIPISSVEINRNSLSKIIDAPNSELLSQKITKFRHSPNQISNATIVENNSNKFKWSIYPYYRLHLFDPDKPIYYDLGLSLNLSYRLKPGLIFSSRIEDSVLSTFDEISRGKKGNIAKVRTDLKNYLNVQETRIDNMTLASYYKLPNKVYGRFTMGYLEYMYAGISSELLYFPFKKNFAIGAELNYVNSRSYDQKFSLKDLDGLAKFNGHLSTYWDTDYYNYLVQVDTGKYLAGDYGSTFIVSRNFPNGWEIGGYFTLTNVSYENFGEGSFDKGIFFKIPFNSFTPNETRYTLVENIRPIQGDGGSRLSVNGRLYELLSPYNLKSLNNTWQTIWR